MSESRAQELASSGFSTLALAYFGVESLPSTLQNIPLEYFEKAFSFLKRQQGIEQIGLWGGSRGGELSLILGTHFPGDVDAIVAHVPSSAVYGAFGSTGPAWTYKGLPIAPNAPFHYLETTSGQSEELPISSTPSFLSGMQDLAAFEAALIPVEKIQCPLLIISAEDDQMWPSSLFAKQIVDRLSRHQSAIPHTHLNYPNVGHAPGKGTTGFHPILKKWFAYGGNSEANAFAAEDWLKQTHAFFEKWLKKSPEEGPLYCPSKQSSQ
jgi:dienelactone hydrolase